MIAYNRWLADDGRHCTRCGADIHPPDPPHLCKDLAERYERQAKAVALVTDILAKADLVDGNPPEAYEEVALDIIKALSGRDLGVG